MPAGGFLRASVDVPVYAVSASNVDVSIYASTGVHPDALVESTTIGSIGAEGIYSASLSGATVRTAYWVVLSRDTSDCVIWRWNSTGDAGHAFFVGGVCSTYTGTAYAARVEGISLVPSACEKRSFVGAFPATDFSVGAPLADIVGALSA